MQFFFNTENSMTTFSKNTDSITISTSLSHVFSAPQIWHGLALFNTPIKYDLLQKNIK